MYRILLISTLLVVLYFLLRQAVRGFKSRNVDGRGTSLESIEVLTEGFMMEPEASVSALVLHHPQAKYFSILEDELAAFEKQQSVSA